MPNRIFTTGLIALVLASVSLFVAELLAASALAFLAIFVLLMAVLWWRDAPGARTHTWASQRDTTQLPVGFGRALLGKLPYPLIVINDRGRITYANTATDTLGAAIHTGDHFATSFRAPVFIETVNAVIEDNASRACQFSLPGRDQVFEAQVSFLPQGGDFGDDQQLIAVIQDRTEEIRANAMRTDFIANASHELRTPLASVVGYIETLQGHAKDDPEARDRFLGIMARQAGRMNRLVEDLLSLSRIEMDARRPPNETCDVFAIVREAIAAMKPVTESSNADLKVDIPAEKAIITGDRDQLIQVATNLIDNAVKYGGGHPVTISANIDEAAHRVTIDIIDKGPGIAREHLSRLTERFYRVNASESRKVGGTGLGLAIVKHILNRHGGGLDIASTPGEGSRFSVWLPLKSDVA